MSGKGAIVTGASIGLGAVMAKTMVRAERSQAEGVALAPPQVL